MDKGENNNAQSRENEENNNNTNNNNNNTNINNDIPTPQIVTGNIGVEETKDISEDKLDNTTTDDNQKASENTENIQKIELAPPIEQKTEPTDKERIENVENEKIEKDKEENEKIEKDNNEKIENAEKVEEPVEPIKEPNEVAKKSVDETAKKGDSNVKVVQLSFVEQQDPPNPINAVPPITVSTRFHILLSSNLTESDIGVSVINGTKEPIPIRMDFKGHWCSKEVSVQVNSLYKFCVTPQQSYAQKLVAKFKDTQKELYYSESVTVIPVKNQITSCRFSNADFLNSTQDFTVAIMNFLSSFLVGTNLDMDLYFLLDILPMINNSHIYERAISLITSNNDQCTPPTLLRKCAMVPHLFFNKPLFKNFPSHQLLQGFSKCEDIFSSSSSFHYRNMNAALMMLMHHNITRNEPRVWLDDLKFFALTSDGIKYLNDFPLEILKKLRNGIPNFWDQLFGIWTEHFKDKELTGFTSLLLTQCNSLLNLLGFLGFFNNEQLQNIMPLCKRRFEELTSDSILDWDSIISLEDVSQEWWHRLLGPNGLFYHHARDCIKKSLLSKTIFAKLDLLEAQVAKIIVKYDLFSPKETAALLGNLIESPHSYWHNVAYNVLKLTSGSFKENLDLLGQYFTARSKSAMVHKMLTDMQDIYVNVCNKEESKFEQFLVRALDVAAKRTTFQALLNSYLSVQASVSSLDRVVLAAYIKLIDNRLLLDKPDLKEMHRFLKVVVQDSSKKANQTITVDSELLANVIVACFNFAYKELQVPDFFAVCENYEFWKSIMSIEGKSSSLVVNHKWVEHTRGLIHQTASSISSKIVIYSDLKRIIDTQDALVSLLLLPDFSANDFVNAKDALRTFESEIHYVNEFLSKYCMKSAVDAEECKNDFRAKQDEIKYFKLSQFSKDFFGQYYPYMAELRRFYEHREYQTFYNHFLEYLAEEDSDSNSDSSDDDDDDDDDERDMGNNMTVLGIASAAHFINEEFLKICQDYSNDISDFTIEDLNNFWRGVSPDKIQEECNHVAVDMPKRNRNLIANFSKLNSFTIKCQDLRSVCDLLDLQPNEEEKKWIYELEYNEDMSVSSLAMWIEGFEKVTFEFTDFTWNVVTVIGRAAELLDFITELGSFDVRTLIDSVEEHSDQFITENTVSNLVDVKRFFEPLLQRSSKLNQLRSQINNSSKIDNKISDCTTNVHGLRRIYKNLANRSELTKETIYNAVERGCYIISSSDVKMNYEKSLKSYSLADLLDLRSRALLIVNSDNKILSEELQTGDNHATMLKFIVHVDEVQQIYSILGELAKLGHFTFKEYEISVFATLDDTLEGNLRQNKSILQQRLAEWKSSLSTARQKYYFLTFLHPEHLYALHQYFDGKLDNYSTVGNIMKFINPNVNVSHLVRLRNAGDYHELFEDEDVDDDFNEYDEDDEDNEDNDGEDDESNASGDEEDDLLPALLKLGEYLDTTFSGLPIFHRPIPSPEYNPTNVVNPREIYVAKVDSKLSIVPAVMSLYSSYGSFPEPHQILFCQESTTWEEVNLLLLRCFYSSQHTKSDQLYCISNIEQIDFEMQSKLVEKITELKTTVANPFKLALVICKGDTQQHLLDQFSEHVRNPSFVKFKFIETVFRQLSVGSNNEVVVMTSTHPGLGKTEEIRQSAFRSRRMPVHFPVSGPIKRNRLIERLCNLQINNNFECLHLDINNVEDPFMIDSFLFELLVVGSVSSGNMFYHRPVGNVFIEIANTLGNKLLDGLPMCSYFKQQQLHWDLKRLKVSNELTSPIQVVCNYLLFLFRDMINKQDVKFFGDDKNTIVLDAEVCGSLLAHYFINNRNANNDMSFTILGMFVEFFSNQLVKFTQSQFFTVDSLKAMLGDRHSVREILVTVLKDVSIEFAHRAAGVLSEQRAHLHLSMRDEVEKMVARFTKMIKWEDSNHLMVVFHSQDSQTISALYRDPNRVPENVVQLLESQAGRARFELKNYEEMSYDKLLAVLEKIARTSVEPRDYPPYALTADNLLKMVLILLRIRARIPVLVMGETGCGKTSLIKFLANTVGTSFTHMDFHAGVTEKNILDFIEDISQKAKSDVSVKWWVFLDEINTCDHLGLVTEMMCNHSMLGKVLPRNIVLLAACNPYKKRVKVQFTAGLEEKIKTDELSSLVYRVHPLPESLTDYVWDYGSLGHNEEYLYIKSIVRNSMGEAGECGIFADLIYASQEFIRQHEAPESVSMRDVKRCTKLERWFKDNLAPRDVVSAPVEHSGIDPKLTGKKKKQAKKRLRRDKKKKSQTSEISEKSASELLGKVAQLPSYLPSIILALAVSYHTRLGTTSLRQEYRNVVEQVFERHNRPNVTQKIFLEVLHYEQESYLKQMDMPVGTAYNTALLENVFVTLVCILNKIPVFIVGKPGCSKSLSMQLINSNLRGPDSSKPFFQKHPQVFVLAFQGSESSTSDGIIKVFDKAKKYNESNKDVIPVVLLDEVGLAEISKSNPLKVLHGLIEPAFPKEELDIAVVGISNWALDAAKMNRAIHLSRPDPDVADLFHTGKAIQGAFGTDDISEEKLENIATAYHRYYEYQKNTKHKNFHGMRDYYSLIKCVSRNSDGLLGEQQKLINAIERNFGGQPKELDKILGYFMDESNKMGEQYQRTPVLNLIKENTLDDSARHLMIISSGDAAVDILQDMLSGTGREAPVIIYGSKFYEDKSEQYSYRVLSQIILCMETGRWLILKDLEDIYGSLYDMLNQNYAYVGTKRNCRIALGPYSNPMCHVAAGFRCIVLVDHRKIDFSDPPFLNRFEKQSFTYEDILEREMQQVLSKLQTWVKEIACVSQDFEEHDMFLGFHEDTLSSLVLHHSKLGDTDTVLEKCKSDLIMISSADGIVRSSISTLAESDPNQARHWKDKYFSKNLHQSLPDFLQHVASNPNWGGFGDGKGVKTAVMTYSSIHTSVASLVNSLCESNKIQVHKIGTFSSEKYLTTSIEGFFASRDHSLLVFQCDSLNDAAHVLLTKSTVDRIREEYTEDKPKHVLLIIHLHRGMTSFSNERWQLNFMSGWRQLAIDTLEKPPIQLSQILDNSVKDLFLQQTFLLSDCIRQQLDWAFLCIKYPVTNKQQLENIQSLKNSIRQSDDIVDLLQKCVTEKLSTASDMQSNIAKDKSTLLRYPTLLDALIDHINSSVANPLAKLIFVLEKQNALWTYFNSPELRLYWLEMFNNTKIVDTSEIMDPKGLEYYSGMRAIYKLYFPFSLYFIQQLETNKAFYMSDTQRLQQDSSAEDGTIDDEQLSDQRERMRDLSMPVVVAYDTLFKEHLELFLADFLTIKLGSFGISDALDDGKQLLKTLMKKKMEIKHPIDVLLCWWRHENLFEVVSQLLIYDLEVTSSDEASIARILCESLVPTPSKLDKIGGIVNWQQQLISILSKLPSLKVQLPEVVHVLRICNEFANIVLRPTNAPATHICQLSNTLLSNTLGSTQWVQDVFNFIDSIKSTLPVDLINQFICSFSLRANDLAKEDDATDIITFLLEQICTDTGLILHSGTFISLLLDVRNDPELGVLELEKPEDMDVELELLNESLTKAQNIFEGDDNQFSTLCCDCVYVQLEDIDTDQINVFANAMAKIRNRDTEPILLVIAVAYLKRYLENVVAKAILDENSLDITEVTQINEQFSYDNPRINALKIYVLKVLLEKQSIMQLKSLCISKTSMFPWLGKLVWNTIASPMPFEICSTFKHYDEFGGVFLSALDRNNNTGIDEYLAQCQSDLVRTKGMLGYLADHIYFMQSTRALTGNEKQVTEYIINSPAFKVLAISTQQLALLFITNFEAAGIMGLRLNSPNFLPSVAAHLLIELFTNRAFSITPFFKYCFCTNDLNTLHLIASPEDEQALVINAMEGAHVRYKCSCGYIYFVGNCGYTNQTSNCPSCKRDIGGEDHYIQPGHVKMDADPVDSTPAVSRPGFYHESTVISHLYSVRRMPPSQYRLLRFLTNLTLYFGHTLKLSSEQEFQKLKEVPNGYFEQHLRTDWEALLHILELNHKELCSVFHLLIISIGEKSDQLSSPDLLTDLQRNKWEQDFNLKISVPILASISQTENLLQQIIATTKTTPSSTLETEILEQVRTMDTQYRNSYLPHLLRVVGIPSQNNMRVNLENSQSKLFPFMSLFVKHEAKLALIKHLRPILEWTKIVTEKLSYRIDRSEAQKITIKSFLENQDSKVLQPIADNFLIAWDKIRKEITRYQCHELKQVPAMSLQQPISYCCLQGRDTGVFICAAIDYLVELQNNFLKEVLSIANNCSALLSLKHGEDVVIRSCSINELSQNNVIDYEWDDEILCYSQLNLEYGKGKEVIYNFKKMELELAHNLVVGKTFIHTDDMEEFKFNKELFHGFSTILQDVRDQVPQEKLLFTTIEALKNDSRVRENAKSIMTAIDFIMTYVKRSGADPKQKLIEYATIWRLDAQLLTQLKIAPIQDIQLQNIISLYEEVEDLVADRVVEWVDNVYCEPISDSIREDVAKLTVLPLENLVITFKRFMFRFLTVEKLSASTPLIQFIPHLLLCWPHDKPISEDSLVAHFPESLLLSHTKQLFDFLQSKQQVPQKKVASEKSTEKSVRKVVTIRKRFNNY